MTVATRSLAERGRTIRDGLRFTKALNITFSWASGVFCPFWTEATDNRPAGEPEDAWRPSRCERSSEAALAAEEAARAVYREHGRRRPQDRGPTHSIGPERQSAGGHPVSVTMLKPPRRARARSLPPGAEDYRPRPKPIRRVRPPAPLDLQLTDEQLEQLRAIASAPGGCARIPDVDTTGAWPLWDAGLIQLEPTPPSPYASRPAWRPALGEDRRPWRATITEHGRRVLERTEGAR